MDADNCGVEPFSQPLGDLNVTAILRQDPATGVWEVTVVFTKDPNQGRIEGADVDAELLDDTGTPLPLLDRPAGPLVEAGGSLGVSANAQFRFQAGAVPPAELLVSYGGETARFQVVAQDAGTDSDSRPPDTLGI